MFDGIEVDVLSLGDADCVVVTKWSDKGPLRILIDGGCGKDAGVILDFLRQMGYSYFWAVLCTHLHNDHASGLIKLVRSSGVAFSKGWMHDITKHVSADTLRRASAGDDAVKQVVETTKELAAAFASRNVTPLEPFTGMTISAIAGMTVLGPSLAFYNEKIAEFAKVDTPAPFPVIARPAAPSPLWNAIALHLGGNASPTPLSSLAGIAAPSPNRFASLLARAPLADALSESSVKKNPKTQPYNNTSVILGVDINGMKLLFPADAGSEALAHVPPAWNHLAYMGVPHHASDGNLSQKDIERFCPQIASISAKGDSSHPSRAIVSGLVKVGTKVASTHKSGNLWFWSGSVPARTGYGPIEWLKGTGEPEPIDWMKVMENMK
jgi:beta-lactamase superfamily II metal-dependent hydrolase